jgi:EAL domain-containing protein (putative c-di-GMP-specific phosphodiesterase class I)
VGTRICSLTINDHEFFITASVGIAIYPIDGEDVETLIKNADMAMYNSKALNKNQYTICSTNLKEDILMKMKLKNSLYRALDNGELMIYYQPQINSITNKIIGMEALARWKHTDLGMISPCVFIPIAERTGLIHLIGQWVLKTACLQNKSWQDMGFPKIPVSVNLSVEQFNSSNLQNIVKDMLELTGLSPEYLELEITENIAIRESKGIVHVLDDLKNIGVSLAIDDFGTKYSSLSWLKNLPVDKLKIDMQFIQGISKNNKDELIIEVIIYLAKRLGLSILAEGVETKEQLDYLIEKGCNNIQGYYYYKPMSKEDIEILLEENRNKQNNKLYTNEQEKNIRLL